MSEIIVHQSIEIYEVDDVDVPTDKEVQMGIHSHWALNDLVILEVEGKKYTVMGETLIIAVRNAMNTGEDA